MLIFKPDWKRYGKGAGIIRNRHFVENSDIIIAFLDEKSKGTKNTINYALKIEKSIYIWYFTKVIT